MKQQPQIPSTMLPGQLLGSSHLDSSQGKQTRARVPDSPSSRASRNSHPAAARCQPPSPPGRLLPAETAARYIPAAAARPGPGEPLGSPLAGRRTRACRGSFPPPPPPAPRGKFPLSAAAASAKLLLRVAAPPAAPSGKRRPSVRPSVPRPPAPGSAAPCVRASCCERGCGSCWLCPPRVPSPDSPPASLSPRSKCALCPAPIGRSSPPHRPKRPCSPLSLGTAGAGPPPFLPRPPSPRSRGWKRRSGGEELPTAWAPQRPPPPPPPAPPLPLPGLRARSGAGRRRQTAGTGWRRPGGHRGRGERGPHKGRSPSRAMLRGAVNGASPSLAVAARASSSSSACSLEGRGIRDGERLRALSAPAPREESRSLPAPPRSVPAARRPGSPRCPAGAEQPCRSRFAGAGGAVPL